MSKKRVELHTHSKMNTKDGVCQVVFGESKEEWNGTFVVVYVEATGLKVQEDKIIQISACRIKNKEIIEEFSTPVNPGIEIDNYTKERIGITNDTPNINNALKQFLDFCGEDTLVINNAKINMGFLTKALRDNGYDKKLDYVDMSALSRALFPEVLWQLEPLICRELGIKYLSVQDKNKAVTTAKIFLKFSELPEEKLCKILRDNNNP